MLSSKWTRSSSSLTFSHVMIMSTISKLPHHLLSAFRKFGVNSTTSTYYGNYSTCSTLHHDENAMVAMEWYRKLIKKASFIPNQAKRKQILQQIRKEFKDATQVSSSSDWIKKAEQALQFLTMITPKTPTSKQASTPQQPHDGIVKYVKIDGEWVDVRNVDPDKLQKRDLAYMKGGSEDSFAQSTPFSCPPGGCGRCQ
ncbi:hypothetical protein FDP41_007690 [Naegleria fowleri]|uniref:Uncharacterized protein n=1 Tax=Naegleria fowleri TaxID=5763 RepID=A0A6A5CES1_NAEFO|nr:uncharacterized protein FDP41_007690 [Naegleria fowleri]KAF0983775.1 hypothetical protein FDP41_007690 [Naegleria fowleri]CAG4711487.1 unnamed protein product [Naegleria fowleri]